MGNGNNGGDTAATHVTPGGGDKEGTAEEALREQAQRAFLENFPDLGIELDPTKGEISDVLDYLLEQQAKLDLSIDPSLSGWERQYVYDKRKNDFFAMADTMLAPYAGFGQDKPGEPERIGDPLGTYFEAVDRMLKEMTGPFPEARYFGAEGYRESYETLTPSSYDEWIQAQEEPLRAEFMSEAFQETDARMRQFAGQMTGLDSDARYVRMLQLSEAAGLDAMTTYEEFLAEKQPLLEQKYRYLKPLGDEPQEAWREAFPDLYGEGALGTPFSKFLGEQQEGLMQQYEDVVRGQLREGAGTGGVPDLEDWLQEQRSGVEAQYRYYQPLGEEPEAAWASAFPDLFGEGAQVTPLSQFAGRQQEGLMQQYETLVREQMRGGTAVEDLPNLEDWFRQERTGIERSFEMSGPQYTGRSPTGIFRPKKRIM